MPTVVRRALDVGCARGAFGQNLKRHREGAVVHGVELDLDAAEVAARRLDKVHITAFPSDVLEGPYDVITFLDVLEHMVDPVSSLKTARNLLADGGVVVASIPNVRHYSVTVPLVVHGRWDYQDEGILDRTHLRFFTKDTIEECFRQAGYRLDRLESMNFRSPGRWSLTWLVLQLSGRKRREEMTTVQYAVVARSM